MQKRFFCRIFMALTVICTACGHSGNIQSDAEKVAQEFAEAYFNYDFKKATGLVTEESRKWIEFKASNVSMDDIALLREQNRGASVETTNAETQGENMATVTVSVSDFLESDSIAGKGHIVDNATFDLQLEQTAEGVWKVRMEGPLRSGK